MSNRTFTTRPQREMYRVRHRRWKIAQLAERWWWKSYLSKKDPTEYREWKQNYWLIVLQKIGYEKEDFHGRIADIGCGPNGIFQLFENSHQISLFDPLLDDYIHFDTFKKPSKSELFSMKIEDFKGKMDHKFVFCLNAINHMYDMSIALQKMMDILSENGTLILSCDVHNWSLFHKIFRFIPGDILHPHQITKNAMDSLLTHHGLAIRQCQMLNKKAIFSEYVWVCKKSSA